MHTHPIPNTDPQCLCGALIRDDVKRTTCRKCHARATWERRSAGIQRHPRRGETS